MNKVRINDETKSITSLKQVKDFMNTLSREFQSIWKENSENYENNIEAIENIVTKSLHDELINIARTSIVDKQIRKKLRKYAEIKPEHLEIPEYITSSNTYGRAIADLQRINHFKSPKDKLTCIVNACKLVNGMLLYRIL